MDLEAFRDKRAPEKDWSAACETLWSDHVRTDLIYSKKLMLCLPCLGFFYDGSQHDHPKEHCLLVQRFLMDHEVTSLSKFTDFLRGAANNTGSSSQTNAADTDNLIRPSFSTKHSTAYVSRLQPQVTSSLALYKDRVLDLNAQLQDVQAKLQAAVQELKTLRKQHEECLLELLTQRQTAGQEKKTIALLVQQVLRICEDSGCLFGSQQQGNTSK